MTDRQSALLSAAHRMLLALSVTGGASLMIIVAEPRNATSGLKMLPYMGWGISPFLFAFVAKTVTMGRFTSALTYLALSLMSSFVGFAVYVQALFFDAPDAQSGLIFLVVPVCQLLLVPCLVIVSVVVGRVRL